MLILSLKTASLEAEIGLYIDSQLLAEYKWPAHRQLAESLQIKIKDLMNSKDKTLEDIGGIVCFKGPGSFTGLRIGLSAANALAYALEVPIVGSEGENWQIVGLDKLADGQDEKQVLPHYGSEPHVTKPRR